MILEGLFGGVLGGLLRMAPEVIKFFDRKDERKHELNMLDKQLEGEKLKGDFRVEEKYVDFSTAQLDALSAAYKEQEVAVSKASQWVASASAFVRPGITYGIFALYLMFKVSMIISGLTTGQPWLTVLGTWNVEDVAMLNMILSYWFVSRSIDKYRK